MNAEGALARAGIGCGATVAVVVAAILVTIGTIVISPWVAPETSAHHDFGQGIGFLLLPFLAAAPIVGLFAAWKPRVGAVLGMLLVLALVALFGAALAGM